MKSDSSWLPEMEAGRHVESAVTREDRIADAVTAVNIRHLRPFLLFVQDGNDPLFSEP